MALNRIYPDFLDHLPGRQLVDFLLLRIQVTRDRTTCAKVTVRPPIWLASAGAGTMDFGDF